MLWYGQKQIGQAFRNIEYLESIGKKIFFVTNSSKISRAEMGTKLTNGIFGYKNLKMDHLYPSSSLASLYIKQNLPNCKKVWVIGSDSLKEELQLNGIELADEYPEFDATGISSEQLDKFVIDKDVGAVV